MRTEPYPKEAESIQLYGDQWYTPDMDARWLLWKAVRCAGNILEIGTNEGETSRALASAFPDRRVWTVDFPGNPIIPDYQKDEVPTSDTIGRYCKDIPNVTLLIQDSKTLDYSAFDKVGLVFIDGDHSVDGVKLDSELALAYFANGGARPGCIVWHDYGVAACGVTAYLDSRADLELVRVSGTPLVYVDFE